MFAKLIAATAVAAAIGALAAHSSGGAGKPHRYVVRPGDTLWSIAAAYEGGDPRAGVERLERANGLASPLVRPGQRLLVP